MLQNSGGGITIGRVFSGLLSFKINNKQLIITGLALVLTALIMIILVDIKSVILIAFVLLGIGLAPIYPSMIHETPEHFGLENSQTIIGYQVGFAATGSAFLPPVIGVIVKQFSLKWLPIILLVGVLTIIFSVHRLYAVKDN